MLQNIFYSLEQSVQRPISRKWLSSAKIPSSLLWTISFLT